MVFSAGIVANGLSIGLVWQVGDSLQNRHLPSNVTGLTTALLLSKTSGYKITVAAKHMPGDYDIQYASPWAGANSMP